MIILRILYILITWPILAVIHFILLLLGLIIVPIALHKNWDMKALPIWGNSDGIESWFEGSEFHWYAIRNPANNRRLLFTRPDEYTTHGHKDMESHHGLQWQYRYSRWMDCIRFTWGEPRTQQGKRELYIGWKLGNPNIEGIAWTVQRRV